MKVLIKLDRQILSIAELIMKKWNWFTGKNQFTLARVVLIILFSSTPIVYLILPIKDNRSHFFLMCTVSFLLFLYLNYLTGLVEKVSFRDAMSGVKRGNPSVFLFVRLFSIFSIVLNSTSVSRDFWDFLFYLYFNGFFIFWVYLLFVPTPPFKRSQVLEAIRNLFAKPVLAPIASHQ